MPRSLSYIPTGSASTKTVSGSFADSVPTGAPATELESISSSPSETRGAGSASHRGKAQTFEESMKAAMDSDNHGGRNSGATANREAGAKREAALGAEGSKDEVSQGGSSGAKSCGRREAAAGQGSVRKEVGEAKVRAGENASASASGLNANAMEVEGQGQGMGKAETESESEPESEAATVGAEGGHGKVAGVGIEPALQWMTWNALGLVPPPPVVSVAVPAGVSGGGNGESDVALSGGVGGVSASGGDSVNTAEATKGEVGGNLRGKEEGRAWGLWDGGRKGGAAAGNLSGGFGVSGRGEILKGMAGWVEGVGSGTVEAGMGMAAGGMMNLPGDESVETRTAKNAGQTLTAVSGDMGAGVEGADGSTVGNVGLGAEQNPVSPRAQGLVAGLAGGVAEAGLEAGQGGGGSERLGMLLGGGTSSALHFGMTRSAQSHGGEVSRVGNARGLGESASVEGGLAAATGIGMGAGAGEEADSVESVQGFGGRRSGEDAGEAGTETSERMSATMATMRQEAAEGAEVEGTVEVAGTRSVAFENAVLNEINPRLMELRQMTPNLMSVVLRPDPQTELFVELRHRDGQVEIQVRFDRGDASAMKASWEHLKTVFSSQGVTLHPLQEGGAMAAGALTASTVAQSVAESRAGAGVNGSDPGSISAEARQAVAAAFGTSSSGNEGFLKRDTDGRQEDRTGAGWNGAGDWMGNGDPGNGRRGSENGGYGVNEFENGRQVQVEGMRRGGRTGLESAGLQAEGVVERERGRAGKEERWDAWA